MCGINGFTWSDKDLATRMNAALAHRGPDGVGVFADEKLTFGHRLLAITDTPANCAQPVVSPDSRFVMVYNGEIYNYRQLRDDLKREGERFVTEADTEMLFAGLRKYGADFLKRLDGMFAIGFYDKAAGTLLIARDAAGIKPVYWSVRPQGLVFSSELRGLFAAEVERTLDVNSAGLYMALGYVAGPATLVRGVNKLCPGQYLRCHIASGTLEEGWFDAGRNENLPARESDLDAQLRGTIGASVRANTTGLRPYGMYLSGGLDSGIILHEMASQSRSFKTYTTRFEVPVRLDGEFNEDADVARRLCAEYGVEHHELVIGESEYADAYEAAIQAIEEPRWNGGIGAYWLLAREAAKDITIVLNGSGGDELFFGYPRYLESRKISARYAKFPRLLADAWYSAVAWRRGRIGFGTFLHLDQPLERWAYLNRLTDAGTKRIISVLGKTGYPALQAPLADTENAVAELDRLFWLADEEYIRTDKIAMHFGMEGRFPLMGREVVRLANAISADDKLAGGTTKHLLRCAYRGYLPDYVVDKPKTGWKAPVGYWMNSTFGQLVREALSAGYYDGLRGVLDPEHIRAGHIDGVEQFSTRTMKYFLPAVALQVWARSFRITV